jgi:hypothetical protein
VITVECHRCGRSASGERVAVRALCAGCGAYLHCCRNCEFYAPGVANDCREPSAERVADKEQGNFCDWFRPSPAGRPAGEDRPSAARAQLEALFAKRPFDKGPR